MRKQSPMYSCWATMVITEMQTATNKHISCVQKTQKSSWEKNLQEKTHEGDYKNAYCNMNIPIMYKKNPMYCSWERIHLQRKNLHNIVLKVTNHVQKKVAPIHPSVCWTPRAIASPRWVVGVPHLTSPLVCEEIIFVRLLKDIKRRKASSITELQKILLYVLLSNLLCTMLLVTKPRLGFRV